MPSPFPGMDPWLEGPDIFSDLHNRLITVLCDAVNVSLPAPYFAAIANRIWIEESERRIEPDIDILRPPQANGIPAGTNGSGGTALMTATTEVRPVVIRMPLDEITEWFLEIHAAPGGERLVTSIEVLSRSNKTQRNNGRRLYVKKQRELLRRKVNLVEIDLLRTGLHTTAVSLDRARSQVGFFDYHVCVHRFSKREDFELYPIQLPQRLPRIAIPLLPESADVFVNLQDALATCYERGLYSRRVHYDRACDPPLNAEQQSWAATMLQ